jgi:predicted dehydrogenase
VKDKKDKSLRIGIAGYGIVGKKRHDVIKDIPKMDVVAVCDKKFNGKGEFEDGVSFYDNYKSLIFNESIDALIVCMTNDIAPEVTMAGLNAGLHVFCEKPPGRTVEDIENVIKIETKHPNLKLMYGFNHRHHYSVMEAFSVIQSGKMGQIIIVPVT